VYQEVCLVASPLFCDRYSGHVRRFRMWESPLRASKYGTFAHCVALTRRIPVTIA
jgi:hypothetical protein